MTDMYQDPSLSGSDPSGRLHILVLLTKAVIYVSILILFFIISYAAMDAFDAVTGNKRSFEEVVAALGNRSSQDFARALAGKLPTASSILGEIDIFERDPDGRLRVAGWAVDQADQQQIQIFLVIPGKAVLMTVTGDERKDVARSIQLASAAVGFDTTFNYNPDCGETAVDPFAVAFDRKQRFAILKNHLRVKC